MAEETQAASSPAEVEDVFKGQNVSMAEFQKYRTDGELPERFKPAAESEPADTPEETDKPEGEEPKTEPESDPDEEQEQPQKGAEKRIKQLLAKTKELERKLAEKTDVKPEPSTAKPETVQYAHPKPTADDKKQDGTPRFSTYEDFVEALGKWAAKEERITWEREQKQEQAQTALKSKLDEARARYADADDVIFPANQAIQDAKIPLVVKEVFAQSEHFVDLCYVVGSDPDELKKFISLAQSNPRAAIGKVFEYERGIQEELSKTETARDDRGKFTAPEAKKTSAPKPPSPVGGTSSKAFDVSDDSLSADEWMRKRNKQLGKA